jgi:hypothetical protein
VGCGCGGKVDEGEAQAGDATGGWRQHAPGAGLAGCGRLEIPYKQMNKNQNHDEIKDRSMLIRRILEVLARSMKALWNSTASIGI